MMMNLYVLKVIRDCKLMLFKIDINNPNIPPPATGLLSNTLTDCKQEAINESAGNTWMNKASCNYN